MMYRNSSNSLTREVFKVFAVLDSLGSMVNSQMEEPNSSIEDENAIDVEWKEVE